jgi:phosphoglycolate phosphatase-like HAD superfamily hydrolase
MKAAIFDIDGTLADTSQRVHHLLKSPKDWDAFHNESINDKPHRHIVQLAFFYAQNDYCIVLCAGREEGYRAVTVAWVEANGIPYANIYMRSAGDRRDDSIIKLEMLSKMRADNFDPIIAFDDRDRVVAAWRSAGIPCLQVAPGDF